MPSPDARGQWNRDVPRPGLPGRAPGVCGRAIRVPRPALAGRAERRVPLAACPPVFLAITLLLAGCTSEPGDGQPNLLPPERGSLRRATDVTRYTPQTLHEYINGQAPYVVSFGMLGLATADYRQADEPVTTVDVYDMGSADNAFAIFRSNADVEGSPLDLGAEGAGADGRIEFWKNRYYVVVSNPLAEDPAIVRDLAERVAADIPPTDAMPAYLGWLPEEGRVARSEKYLAEAYLGYESLTRCVTARFAVGEGETPAEVTLFVCRYDSPDAATAALEEFKKQVAAQSTIAPLDADSHRAIQAGAEAPGATGGSPASAAGDAEAPGAGAPGATGGLSASAASPVDGFIADKFVMGRLIIFRSGPHLAGILPYSGTPPTRTLLGRLAKHVEAL